MTGLLLITSFPAFAQGPIPHQISLGAGKAWCEDSQIYGLLTQVNNYRAGNGLPALKMDSLGMKVAELRAVQFADYMATHSPGSPGFWPHEGWDTTAASVGYNIISENLAYISNDPAWIVYNSWQDTLHRNAMLASDANVAGVSCISSDGTLYWTYEPGSCTGASCGQANSPNPVVLDSEQWEFLRLINEYRAANGAGPLQVSSTLQAAAQWMSADMEAKNYFSHTDSLGRTSGARIRAFGYAYSPWGENIAAGFSDARSVLEGWKNACDPDSTGKCTYAHRLAMLHAGFTAIGIGRAGVYWTTDFGGYLDQVITPPGTNPGPAAPVISSFTASPAVIAAGQSAQLSWAVTGATTVSLNNGIGAVTGSTAKLVAPAQTTTYVLTAANSAGSATAMVTVTVTSIPGDTVKPSTPAITSATARSATQVDLAWTQSSDNVAVTGYEVARNGTAVATLAAATRTWSDTGVLAGKSYSYTVRAFDASGNYSAASPAVSVATPAAGGGSATCPGPSTNAFTGCYYPNTTLTGNPALTREDPVIDFDWGSGSPNAALPPYNFSVRWQGDFTFIDGLYNFVVTASDGVRLYVDGTPVLDRWGDQGVQTFTARNFMTAGSHRVTLEYYERSGSARAQLTWQSFSWSGTAPVIATFTASPSTIAAGQSTVLAWSVSDAGTVSIDNGVGPVSSGGSKTVTPNQTTTYKLTASNSAGTKSATVTVTVAGSGADTQPPDAPVLKSAVATGPGQVNLTWTASRDNVGVTGYRILRNGTEVAVAAGTATTYSDKSVAPATTYVYTLQAYDAMRNYSAASNSATVTTPAVTPTAGCPAAGFGTFTACYYNNTDLTGDPAYTATDSQINFTWKNGFPNQAVTPSGFSVRWRGNFAFDAGAYTFNLMTSDGMRLYIDGELVLDRWRDQPTYMYRVQRTLTPGNHLVVVEFYSRTGAPEAQVSWQKN